MKTFKTRMSALTAIFAATVVMVSCAGLGGVPKAPAKPKQATELLDWKNAGLNSPVPEWVMQSAQSDIHIQSLAEFKDQYCFVVSRDEDTNKDFAITWVGNAANGAAEVARIISTSVNNTAETQVAAKSGADTAKRVANEMRDAMSNASFKGFRRASDFWTLSKNKKTRREYYTAYSLWVIPQRELDEQLAANYQNIIDNNKEMSAAEREIYRSIIADIRKRGIVEVSYR